MQKLRRYINPLAHIGKRKYSVLFPLWVSVFIALFSEAYLYSFAKDPDALGAYIIFFHVISVIYFAFRDGIRGGLIASIVAILYFVYFIYTRERTGEELRSSVTGSAILGISYITIALMMGWLKQKIDVLVYREADEKKRLQMIIQQLPVGVIVTDDAGHITQANKRVSEILGRDIRDEVVVGKDTIPNATYKGKPVKSNQWPLAQALNSGKSIVGKEFVIEQENGKLVTAQISASVVKNAQNEVIAAASIINDISSQKEVDRQKDEFIGIASHELKTPVTSIKAYTQVLIYQFKQSGDRKALESLKKMDAQLNKLTDLIGDLLDVTRMETGKMQFNNELYDFDKVVKDQVAQLQLTTDKHTIVLSCKTKQKVFGDSERIGQVITNLVSNAIKYSPHTKKILVKGSREGKNIMLCVQDFGIGMSKKNRDKVFERFYRVSGPNNQTFPGLGLGLYISSEIVKRMGGRIWVESEEGKGSTFCFTVPINEGQKNTDRS